MTLSIESDTGSKTEMGAFLSFFLLEGWEATL